MLVEKALQYISYKLILVFKNCLKNNFNPITGQPLLQSTIKTADSNPFQEMLANRTLYSQHL